jgi:hypothetical protein
MVKFQLYTHLFHRSSLLIRSSSRGSSCSMSFQFGIPYNNKSHAHGQLLLFSLIRVD